MYLFFYLLFYYCPFILNALKFHCVKFILKNCPAWYLTCTEENTFLLIFTKYLCYFKMFLLYHAIHSFVYFGTLVNMFLWLSSILFPSLFSSHYCLSVLHSELIPQNYFSSSLTLSLTMLCVEHIPLVEYFMSMVVFSLLRFLVVSF